MPANRSAWFYVGTTLVTRHLTACRERSTCQEEIQKLKDETSGVCTYEKPNMIVDNFHW